MAESSSVLKGLAYGSIAGMLGDLVSCETPIPARRRWFHPSLAPPSPRVATKRHPGPLFDATNAPPQAPGPLRNAHAWPTLRIRMPMGPSQSHTKIHRVFCPLCAQQ